MSQTEPRAREVNVSEMTDEKCEQRIRSYAENNGYRGMEFELLSTIAALRAKLQQAEANSQKVICSYCGLVTECGTSDVDVRRKACFDHIVQCEKRPENQLINKCMALEAQLAPMDCGHLRADLDRRLVSNDFPLYEEFCRRCAELEQAKRQGYDEYGHVHAEQMVEEGIPLIHGREELDAHDAQLQKDVVEACAKIARTMPMTGVVNRKWLETEIIKLATDPSLSKGKK